MVSIRGQSAGAVTVGLILAMVFATFVHGSPMMYKRNDQSNFEAGEKRVILMGFTGIYLIR